MRNQHRTFGIIVVALALGMFASSAAAQSASLLQAEGRVYSAAGPLAAGAPLDFGTNVMTGPDGFAVVHIEWPTPRGKCWSDTAFGFGEPYQVPRPGGPCVPGITTGPKSTQTRLDVGKPDPTTPEPVLNAALLAEFDAVRRGMRPLAAGQNRVAHDFNHVTTASAGECSLRCANDSRCVAMTFLLDDGSCWLKDELGSAQSVPVDAATSSIKRSAVKAMILSTTPPR